MIHELCGELGLRRVAESPESVAIELEQGIVLRFANFDGEDDCILEFEGTPWHAHGDLLFARLRGDFVEVDHLSVITGLADGTILIAEHWKNGELSDRWLVHREYIDEFTSLERGNEIRIRPISPTR